MSARRFLATRGIPWGWAIPSDYLIYPIFKLNPRRWGRWEIARLRALFAQGLPDNLIARSFRYRRNIKEVECKRHDLRLLRR